MTRKLLIEPHYLGSLEYYALLLNFEVVHLEVNDRFEKQTYRNRCQLLGANKVQLLSIPVNYSHQTKFRDVTIDYQQRWVKDHWGAFYSSYGKAPFFEYFGEEFKKVWESAPKYLFELNLVFLELISKLLGAKVKFELTESLEVSPEEEFMDYRNVIKPKIHFSSRNIYQEVSYSQLFGDSFASNLSVVDLLLCEGPNALNIIRRSSRAIDQNT